MPDDLLGMVKAELSRREPLLYLEHYIITDWLRALVTRCEQAEADLTALRQRHAEAVEAAFREGCWVALVYGPPKKKHKIAGTEDDAWYASDAKARLT